MNLEVLAILRADVIIAARDLADLQAEEGHLCNSLADVRTALENATDGTRAEFASQLASISRILTEHRQVIRDAQRHHAQVEETLHIATLIEHLRTLSDTVARTGADLYAELDHIAPALVRLTGLHRELRDALSAIPHLRNELHTLDPEAVPSTAADELEAERLTLYSLPELLEDTLAQALSA